MSIVLPSSFTFGNNVTKDLSLDQQIEYNRWPLTKLKCSTREREYSGKICDDNYRLTTEIELHNTYCIL